MKAVASRFVCGTGISKTPVRTEMSTGTVMFMHFFAATDVAKIANEAIESPYMSRDQGDAYRLKRKQCENGSSENAEKTWRQP